MKRDLDLIRDIMLTLEEKLDYKHTMKDDVLLQMLSVEDLTSEKLNYHLGLLYESDFIEVKEISVFGGDKAFIIKKITNRGQDFIETIRQKEVWNIVKAKGAEIGNFALSSLLEIGKDYLKKQIGF